ncbi:MAG: alpha/beta hydrolase [Leptospiraceae bacterium]|nr:alpha/beta hydrolase [Leptospiraceae bacterium]
MRTKRPGNEGEAAFEVVFMERTATESWNQKSHPVSGQGSKAPEQAHRGMAFWLLPAALGFVWTAAFCSGPSVRPRTSFTVQKDVLYGPDQNLSADLYLPSRDTEDTKAATPRPALLVLHGGSWQRGNKERMSEVSRLLASQGYIVFNANYRLAPEHPYPAQMEDLKQALQFMTRNAQSWNLDPGRIGVMGYSAGGHLALLLALQEDSVSAVATSGAPTDLTAYGDIVTMHRLLKVTFEDHPEVYRNASPLFRIRPDAPPILLVHGSYDWIVPVEHARRMEKAMKEAGGDIELLEFPDGHMATTLGVHEPGLRSMLSFFEKTLKPGIDMSAAK